MVTMVGRSRSMVRFYFVCFSIVRAIIFEIACNGTQFLKKCKVIFFNGIWAFVFFFQTDLSRYVFFFSVFFFSWKQFKLHSLTHFRCLYFFFRYRKKKYSFLLTHSSVNENVTKVNFSREKKNTVPLCAENEPNALNIDFLV